MTEIAVIIKQSKILNLMNLRYLKWVMLRTTVETTKL